MQGDRTWSAWHHTRTAPAKGAPLTLLYFGDTQNKNVSLTTRVVREAMRHAPDARLALYAGDLVSGGDGQDDTEWGEWFEAAGALPTSLVVAPAPGPAGARAARVRGVPAWGPRAGCRSWPPVRVPGQGHWPAPPRA